MARFSEQFLESIRDRVVMTSLVGQTVKLKRKGRDWWGLCPFHQEKTGSFKVSDSSGTGHCFGCGWHGSQFDYVMARYGCSFPDAVERLAQEAGLPMPTSSPAEEQANRRQAAIIATLERAQREYQKALTPEHRNYLASRGVTGQQITDYGIGYAPSGGIRIEGDLKGAGIVNEEGRHRLRNRITFPIHDRRNRIVGFGGRILGEGQPKYLNTPETEVFQKRATLYNAHRAMELVHSGRELVVSEGYFDVLACDIEHAGVGTMGTALTADHLRALWRIADVPVVCFDGDAAGQRAALAAIKTAMPIMVPGRSLRFATLPPGMDPADVVKNRGIIGLSTAVKHAAGMADAFWRLSVKGRQIGTPDAQAALEAEMLQTVQTISDGGLRSRYAQDVRDRIRKAPGQQRPAVVRSNGNTHHSASPGAFRLTRGLGDLGGINFKEAALLRDVRNDPHSVDLEKLVEDRTLSARVVEAVTSIVTAADIGEVPDSAAARVVDEAESLLRSVGC